MKPIAPSLLHVLLTHPHGGMRICQLIVYPWGGYIIEQIVVGWRQTGQPSGTADCCTVNSLKSLNGRHGEGFVPNQTLSNLPHFLQKSYVKSVPRRYHLLRDPMGLLLGINRRHLHASLIRLFLASQRTDLPQGVEHRPTTWEVRKLSLIHIWRCRRSTLCRSRWSPYH